MPLNCLIQQKLVKRVALRLLKSLLSK